MFHVPPALYRRSGADLAARIYAGALLLPKACFESLDLASEPSSGIGRLITAPHRCAIARNMKDIVSRGSGIWPDERHGKHIIRFLTADLSGIVSRTRKFDSHGLGMLAYALKSSTGQTERSKFLAYGVN